MAGRRFGREQWSVWVSEQAAGDESVAEYCGRRKLSVASFYQWRRKLAKLGVDKAKRGVAISDALIPVRLVDPPRVDVDLSCGATIKLPVQDEAAMRAVLGMLVELGRVQ